MNNLAIGEEYPSNIIKQISRIMRTTLFFLFISILCAQATTSYSQVYSFNFKSISIKEICNEIEKESDYIFVFSDDFDHTIDKKIDISVQTQQIEDVLNAMLTKTNFSYKILDKQIVIYESRNETATPSQVQATTIVQQQTKKQVSGNVTDATGESIIGANIVEVGTTNGTVTDIDGNFSLLVENNATLKITYIGYLEQVINTSGRNSFRIILQEDTKALDELVVIGYGTRQRKSITGAVDQVNSDMFEDRPVSNAVQALQGASANLIIQQKSMNPNDNNLSINIRGVSTMGNNDPLIVIDGLISSTNTLNSINQNDIENISVLKDAGSAAIYGSRSANGVILVTTKKGSKQGKPVVRLSGLAGYQVPEILYQPVEGWQNAMYRNQANINAGSDPIYTPAQIRDLYDHQSEEYWYFNKIMQKGLQQNYNLNISGGSENTTYMVSAGYLNQESNFVGGFGLERYNFRSNLTTEYNRFKITSLMAYNRRDERTIAGGTGNTIINSSRIPPYYYYRFEQDGKYLINDIIGDDNTLAKLKEGGYEQKDEDNFIGSLNIDYSLTEGLTAKGLLGIDLTQHHRFRRDIMVPLYSRNDLETPVVNINPNRMTEDYNNKRYTLSTQFLLDYEKRFNEDHLFTGLLGVSNESYTFRGSRIAWLFTDPDLGLPTTDDAEQDTGNKNSIDDTDQTSISSLFGRLGYNYRDRYYGDLSFRYDGSSKFAAENRWGFFPSFSGAWRISEEYFMEDYRDRVGDLKLRSSYGVLGNQNVANYSYQTVYQMYTNSYVFNNMPVPGTGFTYGNPDLTWEKSGNFNIGIDAGFLNNDLYVSLDYFNKRTWDILLAPEVSSVFGSSAARENAGEMRNHGWEATVNYRLQTGEFNHRFNLNISDSKNEVTDFGGKERIDQNDQLYKLIREGEALGSYFGYKTDGYFQNQDEIANSALPVGAIVQPGDVKYVDQNGDEVIDEKDRVVLGNAFPRYTFGFNYDLSYKNIDFSILFQGVGKRDMYIRGELIEPFHSNYSYAIYQHQLDFWTPTNPDARWPRLVAPSSPSSSNNWGRAGTDIYLLDGAYVRIKNIQLGYTLPKALTNRLGMQKLRISANAQNPLTLTRNSFIDPESSEFGNNMGGIGGVGANSARNYPTLVYYGIGLDIEF
ncbi:MAG: SusC/RagA family TonB-linked outer membrane protein [Bacteroidia bacterium]|nr:SusC/RagA family TonB-linked outer membrane protein [Bacteroidia bacterium]